MDTNIVDGLKKIVGGKNVCGTRGNNKKYLCDQTTPYLRPEASKECVIVFPENTFEVSEIMKLANEIKVNVIARGGWNRALRSSNSNNSEYHYLDGKVRQDY